MLCNFHSSQTLHSTVLLNVVLSPKHIFGRINEVFVAIIMSCLIVHVKKGTGKTSPGN